jgi:uncharacterized protein YbcC (UPF0753/DUF2309 family)
MTMSADTRTPVWTDEDHHAPVIPLHEAAARAERTELATDVAEACRLVPPLWTLRNFVAVNAFMGLADRPFAEATREVDRLFHGRALMPLSFYFDAHRRGRILDEDLRAAVAEAGHLLGRPELAFLEPELLLASIWMEDGDATEATQRIETVADAIDRAEGSSWSRLVVNEISRWCAARFDAGQAAWQQPWRELPVYPAWREAALLDRTPEIAGLKGFRGYVSSLPADPMETIATVLEQLEIPAEMRRDLLTRELTSIAGWAGHLQYRAREAAFEGEEDDALVHLLAIRLAFDGALGLATGNPLVPSAPASAPETGRGLLVLDDADRRAIWQHAYELRYRGSLLDGLAAQTPLSLEPPRARPQLQAVFCIDVRSEVLRRKLEQQSRSIQTVGFAGFFGFPLEYAPLEEEGGSARCPVLIAPGDRVGACAPEGSGAEARVRRARERHERFGAWRKLSVGAYPLVETLGHFFGLRLLTDTLGWTRIHEGGALFETGARKALGPTAEPAGSSPGITLERRIELAEGALRNMGLTRDFARVVLLCGHGSTSSNNPYASGLDCGACGGHRGDVNARVAAQVLGSPEVRAGLAERGIEIPEDTVFVAGLHDTTRDEIELFGAGALEPELLGQIEAWLEAAGAATREERARRLGERRGAALDRRAGDWSEVRPEWGLAGNAAFIAAPRHRTRGLDLEGRAFLHDYDPKGDPDGSILELILTAPLVVASWINLQYYASTVDNDVFGSGDKTLHNVVGRHGVQLGNRSDLQVGLPWQSVHDGERFVHEPMRLTAIVEAPLVRIEAVLGAHPEVQQALENGWIHLLAWDPAANRFHRYLGEAAGWQTLEGGE